MVCVDWLNSFRFRLEGGASLNQNIIWSGPGDGVELGHNNTAIYNDLVLVEEILPGSMILASQLELVGKFVGRS